MTRSQMDLTGQNVGSSKILKRVEDRIVSGRVRPFWLVQCECSVVWEVSQGALRSSQKKGKGITCSLCAKTKAAQTNATKNYIVRRDGRIWSLDRRMYLPQSYSRKYLAVRLFGKGRVSVHRLVAEKYLPNPENKAQVNHIDGNPSNNHVSNLEWNTSSENQAHAYANNLNHFSEHQRSRVVETNIAMSKYSPKHKIAFLKGNICAEDYVKLHNLDFDYEKFNRAAVAYKSELKKRGELNFDTPRKYKRTTNGTK